MKLTGNKILITGGGSGIGLGLARQFMKEGNAVIICGRRKDVLASAAKELPGLVTYPCDVSIDEGREGLFQWISNEHPDINVLVNNAGIQNWMGMDNDDFYNRARQEISINIEAPLHLTHLFLQLKSLQVIMNVSSGLAFVPLTKTPVYSATKAFVHSFTLASRALLKARNIEVIEIIPPALNTDLGGKGIHDQAPPVSDFIDAIFKQLAEGKTELTMGFSASVSQAGSDVLQQAFARLNSAG